MSQNLKKRIFTSLVLFLLLIYFNFTIFFVFGSTYSLFNYLYRI